jgi:CNT family concentrative nucleoside transporter
MDAISHGAGDGMRISLNVIAMLLGFIALIAMVDAGLGWMGRWLYWHTSLDFSWVGISLKELSLKEILGSVFSVFAWAMGVPSQDTHAVGALMGTKLVINEFVAYSNLSPMIAAGALTHKSIVIVSFALCGFANFSSIAIQVGGIGELAPDRRADLAKLGFKALICGTLASYLSATIAGLLL